MDSWATMSPYMRPVLGLLAVVFAFFLIKFVIRSVFAMVKFMLVLGLLAIGGFFYLDHIKYFGPPAQDAGHSGTVAPAGPDFSVESEAEQTTPKLLYAQIVDTDAKDQYGERAILEGRAFKYVLKRISKTSRAQLVKEVNERTLFEHLIDDPDQHRGEAYAPGRGVIVEVSIAPLGPEYGLPGWSVLPAIFVNTAHEVYALRILCPTGSKVFEKLDNGIKEDKLPVVNLAGVFFKNYARQPGDSKEQPWVKPLLICPEVEFVASEEPREVMKELKETGYDRLLPSNRIDGPATDERLTLSVKPGKDGVSVRAWGADSGADVAAFVKDAVKKLKQRLPAEQANQAAAVVLTGGVPQAQLNPVLSALKDAGVTRVCVRLELPK